MAKVNVNCDAVALGHPLDCTGAKLTATILQELKRTGGRYGTVTICIGGIAQQEFLSVLIKADNFAFYLNFAVK